MMYGHQMSHQEQAEMEANMEEYYAQYALSNDELDRMYVQHVHNHVTSGHFDYSTYDWIQVHNQYDCISGLRRREASSATIEDAEKDYFETLAEIGFKSDYCMYPDDWVNMQGKIAAHIEGHDWDAFTKGDYSDKPDSKPITNVKNLTFDEIIMFRAQRREPITESDMKLMQNKILEEIDKKKIHFDSLHNSNTNQVSALRADYNEQINQRIYLIEHADLEHLPNETTKLLNGKKSVLPENIGLELNTNYLQFKADRARKTNVDFTPKTISHKEPKRRSPESDEKTLEILDSGFDCDYDTF